MSRFLDTSGQPTLGIALCGRCSRKFPLAQLSPDPNYPALMVCEDDRDEYDPYRLASRSADNIVLPFYRPDDSLTAADQYDVLGDLYLFSSYYEPLFNNIINMRFPQDQGS